MKPLDIDGSQGEGGGQILRSALTLSLLTGKPFRLRKIRAGRPRPGLQPQHLACVEAAAAIAPGSRVRGAALHSLDIGFEPGEVLPGSYTFRIGTAGSTGLVLQTVFLPLALAQGESTVRIEGGTHVRASPCFDFLERTWRDYLLAIGFRWDLRMLRPGFYPRGGGRIEASIRGVRPKHLQPLPSPPSDLPAEVQGRAITAGLPASIGTRMIDRARNLLMEHGIAPTFVQEAWPGGPGALLLLEVETPPARTVFFGLGEKGKPAEMVAEEAVLELLDFLNTGSAGVDVHSGDQLLLPLAQVPGPVRCPVAKTSRHLLTNLQVLSLFSERDFRCLGEEGASGTVEIGDDSFSLSPESSD